MTSRPRERSPRRAAAARRRAAAAGAATGCSRASARRRSCSGSCWSRCRWCRRPSTSSACRSTNADVIRQQAAEKHLDPALIAGVIYAETKFDPRSSAAGAHGLMQVMPETAEFLAHRSGATTFTIARPRDAGGQHRLRQLLPAVPAQRVPRQRDAGARRLQRWRVERRPLGRRRTRSQGHSLTVDEIPFPETRAYVGRVLSAESRSTGRSTRRSCTDSSRAARVSNADRS